ncbi:bZIP transcription factor [Colletotrichum incanum]|nr:bZIP transcription factor [Colletotrichum incanum]
MASNGQNDTPTPASGDPPAKVPSEKELARKIRKRELDRRAQRQARERTRNRIAELEAQVKELRKDDSTRLSACMEQLAAVTRERDRLVETFKSIEQTIRDHVLPSRPIPAAQRLSPAAPTRSLPSPRDAMLTGLPAHSYAAQIGLLPETPSAVHAHASHGSGCGNGHGVVGTVPNVFSASSMHAPSVHAPSSTSDSQDFIEELEDDDGDEDHDDPSVIVPPPESPCDCVTVRTPAGPAPPRVNVWRAVNQVLAKKCHISKEAHVAEDASDEDIPVRALLEGWDAVAKSRPLSKLWKKLRRVDELCFQSCPPTERLAILRTMHLLLQYHSDPTPNRCAKLPTWYLKRPSQAMPHSYAIDFFVWPGVRERFVFGQHHYCNNQFWELFGPNLHVLWPFEFRDAYKKSVVTGQYQISPIFEQRIMDINAWTMGNGFFDRFPELIADIPSFQSIGQSLAPAVTSPPMPQQASLSQLKEREERLLLDQAAHEQSTQDVMDCTQAMQVFSPDLYSMTSSAFMNEFTPQSFDTNGASYGPLPGYF